MAGTLSAQQREQFLLAYRETFNAKCHGTALSQLYAHFSREFGVEVARLWELVLQDMKDEQELYAELRSGQISRHATKTTPAPIKSSPQKSSDRTSALTHVCRICGQLIRVNRIGALHSHDAKGRDGLVACPGAGLIVASPKGNGRRVKKRTGIDPVNRALPASASAATTGRLNATSKSNARGVGKIIGGGSPGLGKNNR